MPFIPHTRADIDAMLKTIGAASIEDLFDEIPPQLMETVPSAMSSGGAGYAAPRGDRWAGYGRRRREEEQSYRYEDEDQSVPGGLKVGLRVKHPTFGVGTVTALEALDDDVKLVVRFTNVGQKTLRAKFARLQPA